MRDTHAFAIIALVAACAVPAGDPEQEPQGPESIAVARSRTNALTLSTIGEGTIAVTVSPSTATGTSCGAGCTLYPSKAIVTLTPAAPLGWQFVAWSGDCTGSAVPCVLDMSAPHSVTAQFVAVLEPVQIAIASPSGSPDFIVSSPTNLMCNPTYCAGYFQEGTTVTLVAAPDPHDQFVAWRGGPCDGSTSRGCVFTVGAQPTSFTAAFDWFATLDILPNQGADTMLLASAYASDGSIACTNTTSLTGVCTQHYANGQTVQLTYQGNWSCASPAYIGPSITASGDCLAVGSPPSCSLTFSAPGTYTSELDVGCVSWY